MAQGTLYLFDEFAKSSQDGRMKIGTDTIKVALLSVIPAVGDAVPTYGTGGTTNESTNEVAAGGGYTTGGIALSSQSFSESAGVSTFSASNITWTSAGSGDPTNVKAALIYDDSATNKDCIGYMDLTPDGTTAISLLSGNITINWNASGIYTSTV